MVRDATSVPESGKDVVDNPVGSVEVAFGDVFAKLVDVPVSRPTGKRSGCATKPVDLLKPGGDLVPTGGHEGRHKKDRHPPSRYLCEPIE
jgi:hypothetical protein